MREPAEVGDGCFKVGVRKLAFRLSRECLDNLKWPSANLVSGSRISQTLSDQSFGHARLPLDFYLFLAFSAFTAPGAK